MTCPRPPTATTGHREHREHDELPGGERDRIEVLREVRADQDPDAEEERARERERVARVQAQRRAFEQEQPDDREHRPRCTTLSDGRRRVTAVSKSGVNTTNNPVMNAEFDVVVRSSPAFWNQ